MKIQRGSIYKPEKEYYQIAGILLLIGAIQFLIIINLAESQFPGYNTGKNVLSDLGGTVPPIEPSALLFNTSIIIMGILFLLAAYLILKSGGCRLFSTCLIINAICSIGVGLFPLYTGNLHDTLATLAFIFGGLAVIFSYRLGLNMSMVIVSLIIGFISLLSLLFYNWLVIYLGPGGTERLIVYPILFYTTAMGGYLTCRGKDWVRIRFTRGYW
ncbi:MAG: DUF998 domain-containing protein [Methanobacterium sp.]|nr:DUF998 domain-containing protein [Methanobacterium sp.]